MRARFILFLTMLGVAGSAGLQAGLVTFSSVGTAADPNQYQTNGASLAISPNPGWATALPGSSWVSHVTSGNPSNSPYIIPPDGTVISFFQLFSLPTLSTVATVTFRADDSAALYVNGTLVVPEASTVGNTYSTCSDFPVGCRPHTEVTANIAPYLVAQNNVLRFDVAQRNGLSFGLNYAGSANYTDQPHNPEVPEPTTFALIGSGFAALGLWLRKRG